MHDAPTRQRALALLAGGLTLSEVSRRVGVQRSTLREWRAKPIPDVARTPCPRCEGGCLDEPSCAALLGFYLGDGCLSSHPRYWALRVSCDASLPGIIRDVEALIATTRPSRRTFRVNAPGVVVVQAHWQHWICLFPQHAPGRKHERTIALEDWQREIVKSHPGPFLRGLFHSDGSRSRNWATRVVAGERRRYEYPRWEFANRSDDILGLCRWALHLVGIDHRMRTPFRLAVSRREGVARLDALIEPKR